jgi:putative FmdB family regulatory protein
MVGTAEPDMPTYEFGCEHCEIIFEHIYQSIPKKIPKTKKCPECGKSSEKLISAGVVHMKGMPYRMGKTEVNTFYNEAIRDSRERLDVDNVISPYKRYKPNLDVLTKNGTLRKLTPTELQQRKQKDTKIAEHMTGLATKLIKKKKKV